LDKVTDLDAPIRKGIDAVYEFSTPPPKYIITEVKMNTKGDINWKPTVDTKVTKSGGSQMEDKWITHNLDLEFDFVLSRDIKKQGYERILVGVSKENNIIINTLDKNGKVISDNFKVVN
jgi:hypothetical protein